MDHEEAFVRAFIVPEKQERYLHFLASRKRRNRFLARLHHNLDYDPQHASLIPANSQTATDIEEILRELGAPELCHVVSSSSDWDGKALRLSEALHLVVGSNQGTIVSCVPGRLAYYEGEDLGCRYVLRRS